MKNSFLLFVFLLVSLSVFAQTEKQHRLLGKGKFKIHGQLVPALELSLVNKKPAIITDVAAHAIYNQYLYLGLFYNGVLNTIPKQIQYEVTAGGNNQIKFITREDGSVDMYSYGIEGGYIWGSNRKFHFSGGAKIGTGKVTLYHPLDYKILDYSITTFTPVINGHFMPNHFVKVTAGIGYRGVFGVTSNSFYEIKRSDFNGPVLRLGVNIGWFKLLN